ncbi:MAG: response regulator transcription factor [[Clostridium] aminophilum]|uniref:response regulator transcription factor n=1 Tax=[Clostridium] aminophilum TaxID=1526 RepID=UPI0026F0054F|nr:response regulator transcription factor [[Clostridium] aminophilum]MDD6195517.1 response regulator transcription factor [[Clostridium] aminophilum]
MRTILVVEDNAELRELYALVLRKAGYQTLTASDGVETSYALEKNYVDMTVTDIMMPNMDGYEFVQNIRSFNKEMPILMITAKDDFKSKSNGFHSGADDYMVKPIDVNEMLLRVDALFRRAKIAQDRKLVIGSTELDYDALAIRRNGMEVTIPKKEFYLLYKLVSSPNKIFTRRQIMDEIWGMDNESDSQTVDVHINRLRKRFADDPDFRIETVRGLGYKAVLQLSGKAES